MEFGLETLVILVSIILYLICFILNICDLNDDYNNYTNEEKSKNDNWYM